jgi:hypothetical protein
MKRNITKILTLAFVSIIGLTTFGQAKKDLEYSGFWDTYYYKGPISFSIGGGAAFYNGDLGSPFNGSDAGPSFQVTANYKPFPKVQFGISYSFLSMGATHSDSQMTFETTSSEFGLFGKFYFVEDIVRKHPQFIAKKLKLVKPYMTLGIASTTGSGTLDTTNISVGTLVIPIGAGVQFDISRRVAIYIDINYKYTFDDYVDGHESGSAPDSYMTALVGVQYAPKARRMKQKKFKAPKSAEGMVISLSNDSTRAAQKAAAPKEETNTEDITDEYSEESTDETQEETDGYESENSEDGYEETPTEDDVDSDDGYEETPTEDDEESTDDDGWDTSTDDGW